MKILLLNSPWVNTPQEYCVKSGTRWAAIRKRDSSLPYAPFPYLLASATSVLKSSGFDATIKDAVAEEMTRAQCLDYVDQIKPGLLVIETFTPSVKEDLSFIREAKERTGCLTAFCGVHASALPEEILGNDFMDFVLVGEYDFTLRDLAGVLSNSSGDFGQVKSLAYKEKGAIKINPPRGLIMNLDELSFPERDELPMEKYNDPVSRLYPNAKIVTSRGCPYKCIFCIEPVMNPGTQSYRKRSIDLVMQEIELVKNKYHVKEIFFDDAIFPIARAKEIATNLIKRDLKIAWSCWIDWNIGFDDLKLLKESGCVGVKIGIESSNYDIRKSAKKNIDNEKLKKLVANCKKLGLLRHASFMFGLPGETKETIKETIDFVFSLGLTGSQLAIATPLPGTPFYEMAKEKGWLTSRDWEKYEPHYHAVVEYPNCSKEDLIAAMDLARAKKVKQLLRNPLVAMGYLVKLYKSKGAGRFITEIFSKVRFASKGILTK